MVLAPPECLHMRRETHKRHSIYYSNGRGQTSQHKYSLACHSSLRPSTICVHFVTPLPPPLSLWQCPGGFYCVRSLVMADTLFACSCSILLPDWPFKYVSNVCFSGTSAFNNIEIYLHGQSLDLNILCWLGITFGWRMAAVHETLQPRYEGDRRWGDCDSSS